MTDITVTDWLTISAIIIAPLLAVQVQKWIEQFREKRTRQLQIFRTLMTTRAARLSSEHVQALNMIDIEFYGKRKIMEAWKEYLDHLSPPSQVPSNWMQTSDELFVNLLSHIAEETGYHFDKVHLKKQIYCPTAHGEYQRNIQAIQSSLLNLFSGENSISVKIWDDKNKPDSKALN